MNTKCFNIVLAIWIFAIAVPIGFAESFQYRPTETEMDELVTLGTECGGGVYERCYATQISANPSYNVDPPAFIGTNGWYLNPSIMETMASKIKLLVPYYVEPGTEYEMYTVPGLFTELDIGDHTSLFTATPAIGTNAATYGDYPGRIYATNLQERYNAICSLKETFPAASVKSPKYWHGEGYGSSWAEAVADAQANYTSVADSSAPLGQWCKGMSWSNYYSNIVPGEYPGDDWNRGSNWVWWYDSHVLTITSTDSVPYAVTNLIVVCSNSPTYFVVTNILVTGTTDPDMTGLYVAHDGAPGSETPPSYDYWNRAGGGMVYPNGTLQFYGSMWTNAGYTYPWANLPGDYTPIENATGTAVIVFGNNWTNSFAAEPDCSGVYIYDGPGDSGKGEWSCTNGFSISYGAANRYEISSDGEGVLFYNYGGYTGEYEPFGHIGTASAGEDVIVYVGPATPPECIGIYSEVGTWPGGGAFTWTGPNGYYAICDGDNYYITMNTETLTPAWTKGGDDPEGTYSATGTGIYGTAEGSVQTTGYSHWSNTWATHTWKEGSGSSNDPADTVFYQCWLTKVGWSNAVYVTSNIPFASSHYVYSIKPSIGTINIFDDEDLGWGDDVWNLAGTGSGSGVTNEVLWIGGDLSDPPADTSEPTTPNESTCAGFMVTSNRCLLDWVFQYCTDE